MRILDAARTSLRNLLDSPHLYLFSQWILGAQRARRTLIEQYVRPTAGLRVLDVGCGPGYVRDYLPACEYVGIDVEEKYIRYARRRYAGRGTFETMFVTPESIRKFGAFDVALLAGVLHHLSDGEALALLRTLKTALKPGGRVITLDCCYIPRQPRIAKWLIDRDRGKFVRPAEGFESLARREFAAVSREIRGDLFYVPYTLVIMECSTDDSRRTGA